MNRDGRRPVGGRCHHGAVTAGFSRTRWPGTLRPYQAAALARLDAAEAETDAEGHAHGPLRRLHANGRELIARLAGAGPLTLVLDECHHLLDVWGRLVAEVLDRLPDAVVLGLTGTPPESLSPDEAALV